MPSITHFLKDLFEAQPLLSRLGVFHLVLAIGFTAVGLWDERIVLGVNVWLKPTKFALSIGVFLLTMAWILRGLRVSKQWKKIFPVVIGGSLLVEMAAIALQAARGVPSHFNEATAFDGAIFSLMGLAIIANTLACLWILTLFFRSGNIDMSILQSPPLLWGIRFGLLLFLIGSAEGGIMLSLAKHSVGMDDGGPGVPLIHWNAEAGDLRIAHFFGLHALQALPLFGAISQKFGNPASSRPVFLFAAFYFAVFNGMLVHALMGRPLF